MMAEEKEIAGTSTPVQPSSGSGVDPKLAILLSWLLAPFTSILFIAIEKQDRRVKFHAWESLFWGLSMIAVGVIIIPLVSVVTLGCGFCLYFIAPLMYVVNIIAAIKGWNGEDWKLPVIGDWAENQSNK